MCRCVCACLRVVLHFLFLSFSFVFGLSCFRLFAWEFARGATVLNTAWFYSMWVCGPGYLLLDFFTFVLVLLLGRLPHILRNAPEVPFLFSRTRPILSILLFLFFVFCFFPLPTPCARACVRAYPRSPVRRPTRGGATRSRTWAASAAPSPSARAPHRAASLHVCA